MSIIRVVSYITHTLSLSLSLEDNLHLQELNDEINAEKHLHLFRKNAAEFELMKKLAQAHYCTGEHFLSKVRIHCRTNYIS